MSTPTVKSTQIVAGVAVVLALLGGAYAVGRSQGVSTPPVAEMSPPAATQPADPAPQRLASAEPAAESRPAPSSREARPAQHESRAAPVDREPQVALCASCARVTDVHTESRRGEASGVGAVGGAVVGGLLGNMVGGGNGRKLATVAGAVGGGYAGNEIEKNQKSYTVWVVQVRQSDGRTRRFERRADPGLRVGDEVRLTENGFTRV